MRLGIDASNIRAGGGVTHLVELLRAAAPESHGIERIVVWGGQRICERIPKRDWLHFVHDPLLDGPLPQRILWQQTKLTRLSRRYCDVLFVPGGTYIGGYRPFVAMSQNLLPFDVKERRRYGLSRTRIRLHMLERSQITTFRRATGIIFLTETARGVVERQTGQLSVPTAIVPHGIAETFRRPPRQQLPLSAYSERHPFRLLYVSIVDLYKHQWHVAQAVNALRQNGIPAILELIGPAHPLALPQLERVIRQVDPNGEFIFYRGQVAHSELVHYYHQAHGFVFASSCENMPNILVEAMAAGLPIACSQRAPMPEILGNAGVYFDPEQPDDITSALHRLITERPLREQSASLAYQRAARYSWERCARETFSFLVEVARSTSSEEH